MYEYHLDFRWSALDPGCGYERWARLITKGKKPTVYAHVATDAANPGKLALQYWFFYAFNEPNAPPGATKSSTSSAAPISVVYPAFGGDPEAATRAFPWIAFEGRWGELQKAFFNGPTGPNLKTRWIEPIQWSKSWRERSYAVPTGGILGTSATDFFCAAVATGSRGLIGLLRNPGLAFPVLAVLLALLIFAVRRTSWRPATPLRVARRRTWGQIPFAAGRMYGNRVSLFLGIGLLFIPLGALISVVQALLLGGFGLLGIDTTGESAGALILVVGMVGTTLALLGLALVQAATACALVEVDAGRSIDPLRAYRIAFTKVRPLRKPERHGSGLVAEAPDEKFAPYDRDRSSWRRGRASCAPPALPGRGRRRSALPHRSRPVTPDLGESCRVARLPRVALPVRPCSCARQAAFPSSDTKRARRPRSASVQRRRHRAKRQT